MCLLTHKQAEHIGKKYNCNQCDYKGSDKNNLKNHKQVKRDLSISLTNVIIKLLQREALRPTKRQYMKVFLTFAISVVTIINGNNRI